MPWGALTGLPVHELDKHFWQPGLLPLEPEAWKETQQRLAATPAWVMDRDLGPHDTLDMRLRRADTVLLAALTWHKVSPVVAAESGPR